MESNGDYNILDLEPGPTGKMGQVLLWSNYGHHPVTVIATSFGDWLDQVATELIARNFTLDVTGGILMQKQLT
ncbi:hypothetical protein BH11PLA2_BH11PLA2_03580 [soil metagenome]